MRTQKRLIQCLSLFIVGLFLCSLFSVPVLRAAQVDSDGIWTDTFASSNNITMKNCELQEGTIRLAPSGQHGREYTFKDGGSYANNDHRAYMYTSRLPLFLLRFLPHYNPSRFWGTEFDTEFEYPALENANELHGQDQYVPTDVNGHQKAIQHFRFKLDVDPENPGNLTVTWQGKSTGGTINMLYWRFFPKSTTHGYWIPLNSTPSSNNDYIIMQGIINHNISNRTLDKNNYLDINIIFTPYGIRGGTLSTDFIKVKNDQSNGYITKPGYVNETTDISLAGTNPYWEILTWDDYQPPQTFIHYRILVNNSGNWTPTSIGGKDTFTVKPVLITNLSTSTIRLQAILKTNNSQVTPELYSWAVTAQREGRKWQDLFTTSFRVDSANNMNFYSGLVNISSVNSQWPMLGQNPANTRVAVGHAPQSADLYWFSTIHSNNSGKMNTPVVDKNALYFTLMNTTGGSVWKYSPFKVADAHISQSFDPKNISRFFKIDKSNVFKGSPAVSDQYLYVATGNTSTSQVTNYIYALNKNNPNAPPVMLGGDNPLNLHNLSYWSSPIIADDKLFITSWSGDPRSFFQANHNNMIQEFDLTDNSIVPWDKSNATLPAWSFSTPAYSNGNLIVGCYNTNGDSLFAFNTTTRQKLWSKNIGPIGSASPVIVNNTVYVISEVSVNLASDRTNISAFRFNQTDATLLWSKTTGKGKVKSVSLPTTQTLANCTPAVIGNTIYLTSPDGWLEARKTQDGTLVWQKQIYSYTRRDPPLEISPTYADGVIFTGTPAGNLSAHKAANGEYLWSRINHGQTPPAVITSPTVADGLIFYGAADGWLYTLGSYAAQNQSLDGSLITIPIQIPKGYQWSGFSAIDHTNQSKSFINYSLLDQNNNVIRTLSKNDNLLNQTLPTIIHLRALFHAKDITVNPALYHWNLTFTVPDFTKPIFNRSSLQPPILNQGWVHSVIPGFSIRVRDSGSGLNLSSATCTLKYYHNSTLQPPATHPAQCSGTNGTTSWQNFTVDFTQWPEYDNITQDAQIIMRIKDRTRNENVTYINLSQDTLKPWSYISKKFVARTYTKPPYLNATTGDNVTGANVSGVASVTLYYRTSPTAPWTNFSTFYGKTNPHWIFNITAAGHYEVMTRATDKAGNIEDPHLTPDANFTYDATPPDLPVFSDITWFHTLPTFTVTFHDDYELNTIQYAFYDPPRPLSPWTTIDTAINQSSFTATWTLSEDYWNQMLGNASYYLFFKVNDTLGNTNTTSFENLAQALQFRRDTQMPNITIQLPSQEVFYTNTDHFNITALISDTGGSGIQSVQLLYSYSSDNKTWGDFIQYGTNITERPYTWVFLPPSGEGYYQFHIVATDKAGNIAQSLVSTNVHILPTNWLVVLGALVAIFVIVSLILLIKWRRR